MRRRTWLKVRMVTAMGSAALFFAYRAQANHNTLPNRIPEPAPYNVQEAQVFPPPYEADWNGVNNPGACDSCHTRIFNEWNGSMMSNSWRDPGWRGAFLPISRLTATDTLCCVRVTTAVQDLTGQPLAAPFSSSFRTQ